MEQDIISPTIKITDKISKDDIHRIRWLFKKHKGLIRNYNDTANFKEPVLIVIRRSGKVEFYEDITTTHYDYTHSDGTERFFILERPLSFEYGSKEFLGFICHEDIPLPLPQSPLITTEQITVLIEKTISDRNKYLAKQQELSNDRIIKYGIFVAICVGCYILYYIMIGSKKNMIPNQINIQNAKDTVQTTAPAVLGALIPLPKALYQKTKNKLRRLTQ